MGDNEGCDITSVMFKPFTLIMIILAIFCMILLYIMVLSYMAHSRLKDSGLGPGKDFDRAKSSLLWIGLLTTFGFLLAVLSFFYILYQANKKTGKVSPMILNFVIFLILVCLSISVWLSFKAVSSIRELDPDTNTDLEFALLFSKQIRTIVITMITVLVLGSIIGNYLSMKASFAEKTIKEKEEEEIELHEMEKSKARERERERERARDRAKERGAGTDAGIGIGIGIGTDAGIGIGTDAGIGIGTDAGIGIGTDAGIGIGTDTGTGTTDVQINDAVKSTLNYFNSLF